MPSMSVRGQSYDLTRTGAGWRCSCPSYQTSPAGSKSCKHANLVAFCEARIKACRHTEGLCLVCLAPLLAVTARKDSIFKRALRSLRGKVDP